MKTFAFGISAACGRDSGTFRGVCLFSALILSIACGSLARADLVDEKFQTVAPVETGQLVPPEQERLASELNVPKLMRPTVFGGTGFTRENMTRWTWLSSRKAGDHQFNRYRRNRG